MIALQSNLSYALTSHNAFQKKTQICITSPRQITPKNLSNLLAKCHQLAVALFIIYKPFTPAMSFDHKQTTKVTDDLEGLFYWSPLLLRH